MLRFSCPSCNAVMECQAQKVGQKINCLSCGQRLQIPPPPPTKTVLANPLPASDPAAALPWASPIAPPAVNAPPVAAPNPFGGITEPAPILPVRRRRVPWRLLAFLGLAVGVMIGAWFILSTKTNLLRPFGYYGRDQQIVTDFLLKRMDDASSFEVVEWGKPTQVRTKPGIIMHLKWREKNAMGAKAIHEGVFLIQDGAVVNSVQYPGLFFNLEDWIGRINPDGDSRPGYLNGIKDAKDAFRDVFKDLKK